MKVKELMEILKKCPSDVDIVIRWNYDYCTDILYINPEKRIGSKLTSEDGNISGELCVCIN